MGRRVRVPRVPGVSVTECGALETPAGGPGGRVASRPSSVFKGNISASACGPGTQSARAWWASVTKVLARERDRRARRAPRDRRARTPCLRPIKKFQDGPGGTRGGRRPFGARGSSREGAAGGKAGPATRPGPASPGARLLDPGPSASARRSGGGHDMKRSGLGRGGPDARLASRAAQSEARVLGRNARGMGAARAAGAAARDELRSHITFC